MASDERVSGGSALRRLAGVIFFAVGLAVFLVRLHHAGPYGFPADGNLRAAIAALLLGAWFSWPPIERTGISSVLNGLALLASPVVFFFASYATLAELEEVVVLYTSGARGEPAELRLWVMDADRAEWVNMPRGKAQANDLTDRRVELLRGGERACRHATLVDDRSIVARNSRLGFEKYAVKRLAVSLGIFSKDISPELVSVRLGPCDRDR